MDRSNQRQNLPDTSQLSVLTAIVLLAYSMSGLLTIPERNIEFQLPGLLITFPINIQIIIGLLAAGITASGASWLYRSHPAVGSQYIFHHWIVPALTALVVGILLFQIPYGLIWVLGLFMGGGLLILVMLAEFIAIDKQDVRQPLAATTLTSVSYALFLVLAVSLRTSEVRLFIVMPAITIAIWLVSLRVIHLRLYGEWTMIESGIIAIILGQLASAFHYWPFTPISYGLAILGPAYALNGLMISLIEGKTVRQAASVPVLAVLFCWILALLLG